VDETWKRAASVAMDRYACGEDAAFSALYDLLAPRLSSFLMRRVGDVAKTEDLVQQTFLQMHCARRNFTHGADVTAWAYAIARRLCIDMLRKSGRECVGAEHEADTEYESIAPGPLPDSALEDSRLARRVEEELARVPDTQRTAFELVHCDGLTVAEAAEVLGTTAVAIRLRVCRVRKVLRLALGD
jgi:RNA polymerase sigma-70 factor (ECF subfamily)